MIAKLIMFAFVAVLILAGIGAYVQSNQGDMNERIDRECRNSYVGENAIMDCKVRMSARYLADQSKVKSDTTYGRVR